MAAGVIRASIVIYLYSTQQQSTAVNGIAEEAPNSRPREHSYGSWGTGIADDHAHGNAMYRRQCRQSC